MRCWHKDIVKSLPELQLRSQWRELVAMAKDLHGRRKTAGGYLWEYEK